MEEQKIRRALFLSVSDYENEIRKLPVQNAENSNVSLKKRK